MKNLYLSLKKGSIHDNLLNGEADQGTPSDVQGGLPGVPRGLQSDIANERKDEESNGGGALRLGSW